MKKDYIFFIVVWCLFGITWPSVLNAKELKLKSHKHTIVRHNKNKQTQVIFPTFEGWENAQTGVYVPGTPGSIIHGDMGYWPVLDTVSSDLPTCGETANSASIIENNVGDAKNKTLQLTSQENGVNLCASNIWVDLTPGTLIQVTPETNISFNEIGELIDPQDHNGCFDQLRPCGDKIYLGLIDSMMNKLIYVLQYAPGDKPDNDEKYKEIFLKPTNDQGYYERNLYEDLNVQPGVPVFITDIWFEVDELGWAKIDNINLGPSGAYFTYSGWHDSSANSKNVYGITASMIDDNLLVGGKIKFDASESRSINGIIVQYAWNFGDDDSIYYTNNTVTDHIYKKPGEYTVTLVILDEDGKESAPYSQSITIKGLEDGDLIFMRTANWSGPFNLINNVYSHVVMYIGGNLYKGDGTIIETTFTEAHNGICVDEGRICVPIPLLFYVVCENSCGVHTSDFSLLSPPTETFVTAYRVKNVSNDVTKTDAKNFAQDQIGQAYDLGMYKKSLSSVGGYYCSELMWAAYYFASDYTINLGEKSGSFPVSPDDLIKANDLEFIGGHWESYPSK